MAEAVLMPKTGITVESCIIGEWKKKVGDTVTKDEVIFTYETDKAVFDCPSTAEGEILEIYYGAGDEVPCLEIVCAVGQKGDDCSAFRPSGKAASAVPETAKPLDLPAAKAPDVSPVGDAPLLASPRAKRLAEASGVDWRRAAPSGSKGYIIERDVRALMAEPPRAESAAAPQTEYTDERLSLIRRTIARTMKGSLQNSAQLTNTFAFDASVILSYRSELKKAGGERTGITVGDMILFAVSRTLLDFPELNAHMLDDETIRRFSVVNLAVAVDTPRGLIVPVIRAADKKSLLEISKEVKILAEEARSGAISPDKISGGSFTVSNLGSLGVRSFTPVLNPPQTGILGVCTTVNAPRMGKAGIELYPEMTLSLTYDHRAIDGAPASRFMQELCRKLEHFTAILLE